MTNLKTQTMKTIYSIFLLIFAFQIGWTQKYSGNINPVSESGLNQISLSPEVRSATQNNTNNLRIFDGKNNEVPYIIFSKKWANSEVQDFKILSKSAIPNSSTSIIIDNQNALKINHLILEIANTEVDKKYNISGSNDNQQWFSLVNNQSITNLSQEGKTSVEREFTFPLNNYKYLKFTFLDKNSLPINVLAASLEKNVTAPSEKIELQGFSQKITHDKKNKQTKISIVFDHPQVIDQINFTISSPNFYLRNASILINKTRIYKKREENYQESVSNFQLNSKFNNKFDVPSFFTKEFIIEIDNEDNPNLEIQKIGLFQNPENLLADLKSNEKYTIKIEPNLPAPVYDLAQSGINFDKNYPTATITNLKSDISKDNSDTQQSFWQTPLFMWICIVFAVLIIGYFSVSMIKDMNKEN